MTTWGFIADVGFVIAGVGFVIADVGFVIAGHDPQSSGGVALDPI